MNGSIQRIKNSKGKVRSYKVRWREGGKAHSKTFPAGQKELAELFLAEVRARTAGVSNRQRAAVSVGWCARRMMESRKDEVSPATADKWKWHTKHIEADPDLWEAPIADVEPAEVRRCLEKAAARGLAPNTLQTLRGVLSTIWSWAVGEGYCDRNVVREVRTPKAGDGFRLRKVKKDDVLAPDQVSALVEKMPAWAADVTMVLALTGMRQGEAAALLVSDWDPKKRTLSITKNFTYYGVGSTKTYASERTIQVGERLAVILDRCALGRSASEPLLRNASGTSHFDPKTYRKAFRRALAEAGLPTSFTPHSLRHSAATVLISAGVPIGIVSQTLGHSSPAITQTIYSHFLSSHWSQAADAFDEAFASEGVA